MANQRRVPATRNIPRLELLEIQCRSVTIIRDQTGKIIGKGLGDVKEIHTEEEFAEWLQICRDEISDALKDLTKTSR